MKKIIPYILLSLLFSIVKAMPSQAQSYTRFSKTIYYNGDSLERIGQISALAYDSAENEIYFCLQSTRVSTRLRVTWPVLYKMDMESNILKEQLDSIKYFETSAYDVVIESGDKQFLYWGGFVYDTTTNGTMDYILTKTDKDLNTIWRKRYVNPGIRNAYVKSIIEEKEGTLMVLGAGWMGNNDVLYPPSNPKNYLLKIDSSGH